MPGSCLRSSSLALLMSSCFFIGLPAPPLASGLSLLVGALVVVPPAFAIGTDTAPSANSSATSIAMSLVMESSSAVDPSRRFGESRSTFGGRHRDGRVLQAAKRRVDRRLGAAADDPQRHLRAGRRRGHAPREVVRTLDRLILEGYDDVAGLEAGPGRRRAGYDFRDERTAAALEARGLPRFRRDRHHRHAEIAAHHLPAVLELAQHVLGEV